jgi:Rhodopirellula transposase DDE domain
MTTQMVSETVKATFKDAAQKLTGNRKRDFMAKVAEDYLEGSARRAETMFGWNRHSVQLGLHERRTGIICVDAYDARGRHRSEEKIATLEADIRALVEAQSQADPKFQTTFAYARISARAVREALVKEKGYEDATLPTRQTIGSILNRMGYRLKKRKKPNP